MRRLLLLAGLATGLFAQNSATSLDGIWNATVNVNNREIPFRIGFSTEGGVYGWFFNGDEKVPSTSGVFENGALVLRFDHYATRLEAKLTNGELTGAYGREGRANPFHAVPYRAPAASAEKAPNIAGLWDIEVASPKGEKAWHLIVHQNGAEVSAAILRVDGDTGLLTGDYRDGQFTLSHFSGRAPLADDPCTSARWIASGNPERQDTHRRAASRSPRQRLARARRSHAAYHHEGRQRAVTIQLSRSRRTHRLQYRRALPG